LTIENALLENVFNVTEDDFVLKQDKLIVLVNDLLQSLTENVIALALYDITIAEINIAKNAVLNYEAAKETPKLQRTYKKTITATIKKELKAAAHILVGAKSSRQFLTYLSLSNSSNLFIMYKKIKDSFRRIFRQDLFDNQGVEILEMILKRTKVIEDRLNGYKRYILSDVITNGIIIYFIEN